MLYIRANIPPDEPTPEPDIEDDDAELILEKVEEEMMADYDDDDQNVLHIDDITKLYGQNIVCKILFYLMKIFSLHAMFIIIIMIFFRAK